MKITLTGTPGTGKTTVAEALKDEGFNIINLTEFFEEESIGEVVEAEREVPIDEVVEAFENRELSGKTIIEGHLAHHIPSEICIVLRCRPDELEKRLSTRNYSEEKVEENIEAEILDVVLSEAVEKQETVIEIDTTGKTVDETREKILEKIDEGKNDYGNVDWKGFL